MLLFMWLASWITLYCVGHPFAATVDLSVGAGILFLLLSGIIVAGGAAVRKALSK